MSLPAIAKQLEAKGRHGDTKLIHVSDSELKGLHALAEAHGKKITINPETGLPEAFSFSSLLPTIIGAGLSIASGGALSPLMAAGIAGAGYGVATGSLQKGLMAGLGAYGGAGLAEGLAGVGAGAAPTPPVGTAPAAVPNVTVPTPQVAAFDPSQISAVNPTTGVNNAFTGGSSGIQNGLNANQSQLLYGTPPTISTNIPTSTAIANTPAPSMLDTASSQFDKVSGGVSKLYQGGWEPTKEFLGANKMNIGTALAPVLTDAMTPAPAGPGTPTDKGTIRPYAFDYNKTNAEAQNVNPIFDGSTASTAEKTYFTPTYTAKETFPAARGGIVGMALGGQVERDAATKAVGMNTEFPMAHIETPIYANPQVQRPDAKEVVNPSGDVSVDMFTGEPRMASGGIARYGMGGWTNFLTADDLDLFKERNAAYNADGPAYKYDPATQTYTQLRDPTGGNLPFPERTPQEMVASYGPFAMVPFMVNGIAGGINKAKDRYNYVKNGPKPAGGGVVEPKVIGGIAEPAVVTPAQQSSYVSPTERLGLTDFYATTNNALDRFGQQFNPPPPKEEVEQKAMGGIAGDSHLGGYSDGGRLLRGPGDGVSDSIPASIGGRQPARLADGEFVVPARIVSELGNGSTEAGARKLYAMMERVQKQRSRTVGKGKVAVNSRADKHLPA